MDRCYILAVVFVGFVLDFESGGGGGLGRHMRLADGGRTLMEIRVSARSVF